MSDPRKYTILYVDDEESNLRIFKNTFRKDYNILTATSGAEGLEVLNSQDVDLILTDHRMPGMSGIDFLKKAFSKYPELNRILVTAYSDYDVLREAVNELKIFQYVEKPWREEDIKTTINSALEIHRLKIENQNLTSSLLVKNEELTRINIELSAEIDRHKQTQLELIKEKEYAENCNRLKSAFLANMSHEVRTPMNSIMGFVDLIFEDYISQETKREYMNIVQGSCSQLLHIIDNIIEISKIDSGNVELRKVKFEVNDVVNYVYKSFSAKVGQNISLSCNLAQESILIYNDSLKLEQVLKNLLDNALKFTTKGIVEFGVQLKADQVFFYVKDTGIGIDPENFNLIFERFSQVENAFSRKYGGNGLGLAISKAYIENMGGKIWVESELGKGATFNFTIPLD
ncbi:MAG TPA: ATP-binding protein [Prolixibacteraceae bacterium]|nr:ATP-binding protein [Prolixibacteraceae bacterium]HQN94490.1 ATP-binding protein [Prolixibacteraceae bacterium]